jgi:hypothetical protein
VVNENPATESGGPSIARVAPGSAACASSWNPSSAGSGPDWVKSAPVGTGAPRLRVRLSFAGAPSSPMLSALWRGGSFAVDAYGS